MEVETLELGDNETFPKTGERVDIVYIGMLTNGTVFDSSSEKDVQSIDRETNSWRQRRRQLNRPFTFSIGLGHVIRGIEEGCERMSLGEKARIRIPSDLAYGEKEFRDAENKLIIPAHSDLVYEIELLRIWPIDGSPPKTCKRMKNMRSMDVLLAPIVPPGCLMM